MFDFVRVCSAVPDVSVGNVRSNTENILEIIKNQKDNVDFMVFPELATTGYSCGDLFFQKTLIEESNKAVGEIAKATKNAPCIVILGAPVEYNGRLFNCAVVLYGGIIWAAVPKTYLPNYSEFYEKRWFSSANDIRRTKISAEIFTGKEDYDIPFGTGFVFDAGGNFRFAAEICEDLWAPVPPSSILCMNGAELVANLSASSEAIGKRKYRRDMVLQQSARLFCGYIYTSAGYGESTTDVVFSGHSVIAENGQLMGENEKFIDSGYTLCADIDIGKIRAERMKKNSFVDNASAYKDIISDFEYIYINKKNIISCGELCFPERLPFIPADEADRFDCCRHIFEMQVQALKKRVKVTNSKLIVGVSGGLDSTLALLVSIKTMQSLGRSAKDVIGVTMPCFGTTDRTLLNAQGLMESLEITTKNINIEDACRQHFADISHSENIHDVTYENAQARERTQVLMDLANKYDALVVGTGDLSELALGWCTYSGDQMSMYSVNAGIPKTLLRYVLNSIIKSGEFESINTFLEDILDTPISPELLPPDESGKIAQKTEDSVGPYELHDFFIYNVLRYGFSPEKIYYLAKKAFAGIYDNKTVLKWLKTFYRRFFSQQYKRSSMPDGVKVDVVSLSPRGDLRMPSDASAKIWLEHVENLEE